MMDDIPMPDTTHQSPFEHIRRLADDGSEYWSARELSRVLSYTQYNKFTKAIEKAEEACRQSGYLVADHFTHTGEMITTGKGAQREFPTVLLSRYACYLIVQNADPSKPIVALGQTYFAVQTRRQELADQLAALPEAEKRLQLRDAMRQHNMRLNETAHHAGVIQPRDFAAFHDHGYRGLYAGLAARDIHERKGLSGRQDILDYMGSDELAANVFRASLTRQKLEREQITGKDRANQAHYRVGRAVRETIIEQGGTPPEELPTPTESIQQLERRQRHHLKGQEALLPEPDEQPARPMEPPRKEGC